MATQAVAMRRVLSLRLQASSSSWLNVTSTRDKSSWITDHQQSISSHAATQKRWANTSSGFYAPFTLADHQRRPAHHQQSGPSNVIEENDQLHSLHVPELAATLETLKESVSPVAMNSAEFVNTLRLIDEFAQSAGPKLDILLRSKADMTKNWLTQDGWWTDEVYLKSRRPLVINSNPSMIYPPLPFEVTNQLALVSTISQLVSAIIDFRQALVHGYNPEATSAADECRLDPNLCYSQYRHMFGSTRMPAKPMDQRSLKQLSPDDSTPEPFTIVISYRGKFFELQLTEIDNERSRTDQIAGILDKIIATSNETHSLSAAGEVGENLSGFGVLTTANRDAWSDSIKLLDSDSIEAIKEAQFVVCIDTISEGEDGLVGAASLDNHQRACSTTLVSASPGSEQHLAALGRQVLHGDRANIGNRWFDKAFQLIVVADSKAERLLGAGINYEHSFAEGTVITKMIEYSYDKTVAKNRESSQMNYFNKQQFSSQEPVLFRQLRMYDESCRSGAYNLSEILEKTRLDYQSQVDQFDLAYFQYKQYGSNAIKSWRFSPDSWFQVALQSAFYNVHRRLAPCYESASTRRFAQGRTETVRSLTKDVAQFCQNPQLETLTAAIKSHKAYSMAANRGDAIDRALFGYKMTFNELRAGTWKWGLPVSASEHLSKLPNEIRPANGTGESEQNFKLRDIFSENELNTIIALFNNELIQRSTRFALSTSQVSSVHPNIYMAYGPLQADGYGCCYNITGQQIVAAITAANSTNPAFSCDVHELKESLAESMNDMRDLVESQK